jgi:hypothetical protein
LISAVIDQFIQREHLWRWQFRQDECALNPQPVMLSSGSARFRSVSDRPGRHLGHLDLIERIDEKSQALAVHQELVDLVKIVVVEFLAGLDHEQAGDPRDAPSSRTGATSGSLETSSRRLPKVGIVREPGHAGKRRAVVGRAPAGC